MKRTTLNKLIVIACGLTLVLALVAPVLHYFCGMCVTCCLMGAREDFYS